MKPSHTFSPRITSWLLFHGDRNKHFIQERFFQDLECAGDIGRRCKLGIPRLVGRNRAAPRAQG